MIKKLNFLKNKVSKVKQEFGLIPTPVVIFVDRVAHQTLTETAKASDRSISEAVADQAKEIKENKIQYLEDLKALTIQLDEANLKIAELQKMLDEKDDPPIRGIEEPALVGEVDLIAGPKKGI